MFTIVISISAFLLVILIHEFGHFVVAKKVGIRVNEFSIGMGPKIYHITKNGTLYSLRALPVGGYVLMEGEDEESDDPNSFSKVSPFRRIAVVIAGALMNFLMALVLLIALMTYQGTQTTVIEQVLESSPAQQSGLLAGDTIVRVNEKKIGSWDELIGAINQPENGSLILEVERGGTTQSVTVTPEQKDGRMQIGITAQLDHSLATGIRSGFSVFFEILGTMFEFIKQLVARTINLSSLSGPVGVAVAIGQAAQEGIFTLLFFIAFININLGFFNLLPIPALDGGRLVFLGYELITSKAVPKEKEGMIHLIGLVLLLLLIFIVSLKDVMQLSIVGG